MAEWHIGRAWHGVAEIERDCPCTKAPCGLVVSDSNPNCEQHGLAFSKTIRQSHGEGDCPAK